PFISPDPLSHTSGFETAPHFETNIKILTSTLGVITIPQLIFKINITPFMWNLSRLNSTFLSFLRTDKILPCWWMKLCALLNFIIIALILYRRYRNDIFSETSYGNSEFLINYQGGFVRRGLVGEILYQLCSPLQLDPRYIILPICIISMLVFSAIMVAICRKHQLQLWILPTTYGLLGLDIIRKDFLVMCLLTFAFYSYTKLRNPHLKTTLTLLLLLITLNVHEAAFFIAVPLFCLLFLCDSELPYRRFSRFLICAIPISAFFLCCFFKGNAQIAEDICHSWTYIFPDSYNQVISRNSIGALAWGMSDTILMTLRANFSIYLPSYSPSSPIRIIPAVILRGIFIGTVFYLVLNLLFGHTKNKNAMQRFCAVSGLLFLSLLPMFTFVSCDFRRVCSYWIMFSLIAFHFLQNINLSFPYQHQLAQWNQRLCRLFSARYLLIPSLLYLALSVPYVGNQPNAYVQPVPHMLVTFSKKLISHY
ncbi:MAG: hypothetical protein ACI4P8_02150, partial [Akkermansia sp.]